MFAKVLNDFSLMFAKAHLDYDNNYNTNTAAILLFCEHSYLFLIFCAFPGTTSGLAKNLNSSLSFGQAALTCCLPRAVSCSS